jgi:hypothetical protein
MAEINYEAPDCIAGRDLAAIAGGVATVLG